MSGCLGWMCGLHVHYLGHTARGAAIVMARHGKWHSYKKRNGLVLALSPTPPPLGAGRELAEKYPTPARLVPVLSGASGTELLHHHGQGRGVPLVRQEGVILTISALGGLLTGKRRIVLSNRLQLGAGTPTMGGPGERTIHARD